jgi:hypothetical protein
VLGISGDDMNQILEDLNRMGLITIENNQIKAIDNFLHLSRKSDLFRAWQSQARLLGMQRLAGSSNPNCYSFTAVFSATEEARKAIHARFLTFLKEFEADVTVAEPRKMFQLNFDLFPWA